MNRPVYRLLSGRSGPDMEIRILMRETAKAFGVKTPKTCRQSGAELLRSYAQFTADAASGALKTEDRDDLRRLYRKLNRMAFRLGSIIRRLVRPENEKECLAVITALYRNIGITVSGERPGRFCVGKCYFSAFYTPRVCFLISAIDSGIFAGIYHGGKLVFDERITQGNDICTAHMRSYRNN